MSDIGPEFDPETQFGETHHLDEMSMSLTLEDRIFLRNVSYGGIALPKYPEKIELAYRKSYETVQRIRKSDSFRRIVTKITRAETYIGDAVQKGLALIHGVGNEGLDAIGAHYDPHDHDIE